MYIKNRPLNVIGVYNSPSKSIDTNDIRNLVNIGPSTLLVGDYNSKHRIFCSRASNPNGTKLYNFLQGSPIRVLSQCQPTHYPTNGNRPDVLDYALHNNVPFYLEIKVTDDLDSDHLPILVTIREKPDMDSNPKIPNYAKANWTLFRETVRSNIPREYSISNVLELEAATTELTDIITQAKDISIPIMEPKRDTPSLPTHIKKLIQLRNNVRKTFQRTRDPRYKNQINNLRKLIKREIINHKQQTWQDKVARLQIADNSIWKVTKNLTRPYTPTPSLHGENGLVYSSTDKANALADSLEKSFQPNTTPADPLHDRNVKRIVTDFFDRGHNIIPKSIKKKKIVAIIKKLKPFKASGPDNIQNILLKNLPDEAIAYLTQIINCIIKLAHFPQCWKSARVVCLPKPGKDPKFPQNYRPISLLNTMAKITESVILKKINKHLISKNILIKEQFGFRGKHSTTHQLVRLTEHITDAFNKNQSTSSIFLDVEKAFDRVWITGLLYKLITIKLPENLICLLKSYLMNRNFYVSVENKNSNSRRIKAGVPQGSLLGPTLFSIYINDIPKSTNTNIALFADDTCIYANSWQPNQAAKYLQKHLKALEKWFSKWKIKVNVNKSEAINFTRRKRKPTDINTLFHNNIQWNTHAKYLGVILDPKLTFEKHINTQIGKATGRLEELKGLLTSDNLNLQTKAILYKMLIQPILLYAAPAWGYSAKTHINKLQKFQNRVTKLITKCPRYTRLEPLQNNLGIQTINHCISESTQKFYYTKLCTQNQLIIQLGTYDATHHMKHKRPLHILQPNPPKQR